MVGASDAIATIGKGIRQGPSIEGIVDKLGRNGLVFEVRIEQNFRFTILAQLYIITVTVANPSHGGSIGSGVAHGYFFRNWAS